MKVEEEEEEGGGGEERLSYLHGCIRVARIWAQDQWSRAQGVCGATCCMLEASHPHGVCIRLAFQVSTLSLATPADLDVNLLSERRKPRERRARFSGAFVPSDSLPPPILGMQDTGSFCPCPLWARPSNSNWNQQSHPSISAHIPSIPCSPPHGLL